MGATGGTASSPVFSPYAGANADLQGPIAIGPSSIVSCAVQNGGLFCWGYGGLDGLGNNTSADSPFPVAVLGLSQGVQAATTGFNSTCALVSGGYQCWGSVSPTPVPVAPQWP
jgi:hypothetical protein